MELDEQVINFLDKGCDFFSGLRAGDFLIPHGVYDFTLHEAREQILMKTPIGIQLYQKISVLYYAKKASDFKITFSNP